MITIRSLALVSVALLCAMATAQDQDHNRLTPLEQTAGWTLLFDGKSTDAWRSYQSKGLPDQGWKVEDGCLHVVAGGGGGDIITKHQFADFELSLEWRVAPQANSGIIYRATEDHGAPWQTGPEYQIFDDAGGDLESTHKHSAGAVFDIYAPSAEKKLRPVGEFNHTRIRVRNNHVTHWLNGVKLLEYQLESPEWKQAIAASKFRDYDGFGTQPKGHIALQDHGDDVWFRNIKIRELGKPRLGERPLFNGQSLDGWGAFLPDGSSADAVWTVEDGILVCKGQPAGYIYTKDEYANFVLELEWRWSPVTRQAGNSGVLLRVVGEDKVWPDCIEAQLQSGNAGDFWNIGSFPMQTEPSRLNGRNAKKTHLAERPVGEWNEYEIIVDHDKIVLYVNGDKVNEAWDVKEIAGKNRPAIGRHGDTLS